MNLSTDTKVSTFDCDQQDALLAEMQAQLLRDFQAAATMADRASATAGFAQAAEARTALRPLIDKRRHEEARNAAGEAFRKMEEHATANVRAAQPR